jgi:hypothetical protein
MNTMAEFYIINDRYAGEILTQFDYNDADEWEWDGDNILEDSGIEVINRSARFATKEEALEVRDIVEATFRLNGTPNNENDFAVLKLATTVKVVETLVNKVENV